MQQQQKRRSHFTDLQPSGQDPQFFNGKCCAILVLLLPVSRRRV